MSCDACEKYESTTSFNIFGRFLKLCRLCVLSASHWWGQWKRHGQLNDEDRS